MSIREYLKGLDYDQLVTAKAVVDELIEQKNEETKVPLWVICDDIINYGAFPEGEYDKAVVFMCSEIQKAAKERPGDNLIFEVTKQRYRESEVPAMLGLAGEN